MEPCGNPKVQVEAIEGGALQKLLVILATEQPLTAKKKVLFALCSLLRHFPYAQQQFLKLGGLHVLRSLVQEKGMEVLAVRVVTLLYDLVTEKNNLPLFKHEAGPGLLSQPASVCGPSTPVFLDNSHTPLKTQGNAILRCPLCPNSPEGVDQYGGMILMLLAQLTFVEVQKMFAEEEAELTQETSPEKLQQYRQVHLLPGLREQGWCEITAHLLALPEHDAREKVLQTLVALLATCRDRYCQDPQLSRTLVSLQAEYQALAALELQDGEDEGYFRELLGSINSLLKELR
ncbi:hypothetical protein CB1_000475036 [Camelus ferus]|nr:hypothetical protein CB1_000475036 [Camelus ferus]